MQKKLDDITKYPIFKSENEPYNKSVVWLDVSNDLNPMFKVYIDGAWVPIASGEFDNKEDKSNKVTSLSSASTDIQYPSAKCVYDLIGDVESLLAAI